MLKIRKANQPTGGTPAPHESYPQAAPSTAPSAPSAPHSEDQFLTQDDVRREEEAYRGAHGDDGFSPAPAAQATPDPAPASAPAPAPAPGAPSPAMARGALITGRDQHEAVERVAALSALRDRLYSGAREFFLRPGEFADVVFLDGHLMRDGVFDTPMVATHFKQINGTWRRFLCPMGIEQHCVVCDAGETPETRQLFTVVNLQPHTIQKGPNAGRVLRARLQLMSVTHRVREKLVKRASAHGSKLKGSMYRMSRTGDKDPRTGDDIEFVREGDLDRLYRAYPNLGGTMEKPQKTAPIAYETAYPYLTNEEIARLIPGLGGYHGPPQQGGGGASGFGPADPTGDEIPF